MWSEEETLKGPKFYPPVYQQRYNAVTDLINQSRSKRVLDIGCSEGKLLTAIKVHCSKVEMIVGIDIDKETLLASQFRTRPLMAEYLNKREIPLRMALYLGSVATSDIRLANFNFISCIEVIEHLHKEELAAFPAAVFGIYRPEIVVITTPNADFNVLFPNMIGFRHPDHKFEWSRHEFKNWCASCCCEVYGYTAEFSFIGYGPEGTEHFGGCTQMAVFRKTQGIELNASLLKNIKYGDYALITEVNYPYEAPKTTEEKLEEEIKYLVNKSISRNFETCEQMEMPFREISLDFITKAPRITSICCDSARIREIVVKLFTLSVNENCIIVPREEVCEEDIDDNESGNDFDIEEEIERSEEVQKEGNQSATARFVQSQKKKFQGSDDCEDFWV